mmetsp:Transcript_97193/g.245173  ORF Transcript_97193/g.245173 Transcript_97193/m.245173 type:complete len:1258 (+) Transcript_97193:69-3842(+)
MAMQTIPGSLQDCKLDLVRQCEAEAEVLVAQGRTDLAAEFFDRALCLRLSILGQNHESLPAAAEVLTRTANHAASVELRQHGADLGHAEQMLQRTLALLTEVSAGAAIVPPFEQVGHVAASLAPCFNLTLSNLAALHQRFGNKEAALLCLREAEALCLDLPASDAAATHLSLCALLSQLGRHQEAERHAAEAVQLGEADILQLPSLQHHAGDSQYCATGEALLREKASALAVAYNNLAVQREFLGQFSECLALYEKAVVLAEGHMESDNPLLARLRESHQNATQTAADRRNASGGVHAGGSGTFCGARRPKAAPLASVQGGLRPGSDASASAPRLGEREAEFASWQAEPGRGREAFSSSSLSRELAGLLRGSSNVARGSAREPRISRANGRCSGGEEDAEFVTEETAAMGRRWTTRRQAEGHPRALSCEPLPNHMRAALTQMEAASVARRSDAGQQQRVVGWAEGSGPGLDRTGGATRASGSHTTRPDRSSRSSSSSSGPARNLVRARREDAAVKIQRAYAERREARSAQSLDSPQHSLKEESYQSQESCGVDNSATEPSCGMQVYARSNFENAGGGARALTTPLQPEQTLQPTRRSPEASSELAARLERPTRRIPANPPAGPLELRLPQLGATGASSSAALPKTDARSDGIVTAEVVAATALVRSEGVPPLMQHRSESAVCVQAGLTPNGISACASTENQAVNASKVGFGTSEPPARIAEPCASTPVLSSSRPAPHRDTLWDRAAPPAVRHPPATTIAPIVSSGHGSKPAPTATKLETATPPKLARSTAALRIQKAWKVWRSQRMQARAHLLQDLLRASLERQRFHRQLAAASRIQGAARVWQGRRVRTRLVAERNQAATRIQRFTCRVAARCWLRRRRALRMGIAVRRLQRWFHNLTLRAAGHRAAAAIALQRVVRGVLARGHLERDGVLLGLAERKVRCGSGNSAETLFRCLAYRHVERSCRHCLKLGGWEITVASEARGRRSIQQTSLEVSVEDAVARALELAPADQGCDRGWFLRRPAVVARVLLDELVVNSSSGHLSVHLRVLEPEAMPAIEEIACKTPGGAGHTAGGLCSDERDENGGEVAGTGGTATPAGSAGLPGAIREVSGSQMSGPEKGQTHVQTIVAADPEAKNTVAEHIQTVSATNDVSSHSPEGAAAKCAEDLGVWPDGIPVAACPPWRCKSCDFVNEVSPDICVLCDGQRGVPPDATLVVPLQQSAGTRPRGGFGRCAGEFREGLGRPPSARPCARRRARAD